MKRVNSKRIATAVAIASIAALTGCGKSDPVTTPPVGGVASGVVGAGGCLPISGQIPFTASNIYFDWANIVGGLVPMSNRPVGQITIGGAAAGGQYQRSGVDGTISMNITPATQTTQTPYTGYPSGTYPSPYGQYPGFGSYNGVAPSTANATGFVAISPQTQQDILFRFGSQYGYGGYGGGYGYPGGTYPYGQPGTTPMPTNPAQQICVSGIAINVGHYYNTIYGGNVYLYLNNTQHGYVLYF